MPFNKKEYDKKYYQANREKILDRNRKYYQDNKEKIRDTQRKYTSNLYNIKKYTDISMPFLNKK